MRTARAHLTRGMSIECRGSLDGMTVTVAALRDVVESLWPREDAEEWDHPGLAVGDPNAEVQRVVLIVDATPASVAEAIEHGADAVFGHHPLFFRPVDSVAQTSARGRIVADLQRAHCALLTAHTNADVSADGSSSVLARALGASIRGVLSARARGGLGVIADLPDETTLGDVARRLAEVLPTTGRGVAVSGPFDGRVRTIAVCAGAGDSLLSAVAATDADVYITSDLRHHPALDFRMERGEGSPWLIDVSHWASEWLWLAHARDLLSSRLPEVHFTVNDLRTDVWDFVVAQ